MFHFHKICKYIDNINPNWKKLYNIVYLYSSTGSMKKMKKKNLTLKTHFLQFLAKKLLFLGKKCNKSPFTSPILKNKGIQTYWVLCKHQG